MSKGKKQILFNVNILVLTIKMTELYKQKEKNIDFALFCHLNIMMKSTRRPTKKSL